MILIVEKEMKSDKVTVFIDKSDTSVAYKEITINYLSI